LIERLWKFVKGELCSKYYDNFNNFQSRIDAIIDSITKEIPAKNQKADWMAKAKKPTA